MLAWLLPLQLVALDVRCAQPLTQVPAAVVSETATLCLRGDDHHSRRVASSLFDLDREYYTRLPESAQLAYAVAIADMGYLKVHRTAEFDAAAPALAQVMLTHLRRGVTTLDGKEVYLGRWFLLLGRLGNPALAADAVFVSELMLRNHPDKQDVILHSVLSLLTSWRSPLGLPIAESIFQSALTQTAPRHSLALAEASHYLSLQSNQGNVEARRLAASLWQKFDGHPELRCDLIGALHSMQPGPPATEIAPLLASGCHHDLTIVMDIPNPQWIADLSAYLRRKDLDRTRDAESIRLCREALAWQCVGRLRQPFCLRAAPLLRGVRKPSHPD